MPTSLLHLLPSRPSLHSPSSYLVVYLFCTCTCFADPVHHLASAHSIQTPGKPIDCPFLGLALSHSSPAARLSAPFLLRDRPRKTTSSPSGQASSAIRILVIRASSLLSEFASQKNQKLHFALRLNSRHKRHYRAQGSTGRLTPQNLPAATTTHIP